MKPKKPFFPAPKTIKTITIIGNTGNVSWHLQRVLTQKKITHKCISSRGKIDEKDLVADLVIIAVSDSAVVEIAKKLNIKGSILVHTSGSLDMNILKPYAQNYGVIYPLQTLSKNMEINYSELPICVEANTKPAFLTLMNFLPKISKRIFEVSSSKRLKLHLAAVFCSNFTNHLIGIAKEILQKEDIDTSILRPLIMQTIDKAMQNNPFDVQTGPAVREDYAVMDKHIALLLDDEKEIYQVLSSKIINRKP